MYGTVHGLAGRLRSFDIHVHTPEVARGAAVEEVAQRQEDGRLARLPGRVQHEVPHVPNQFEDLGKIEPFQRRNAVVAFGDDGALGVKLAHVSPEVCRMCRASGKE